MCPTAGENQPGDQPERLQRQVRHLEFRNHHGEFSVVPPRSLKGKSAPLPVTFSSSRPAGQIELAILRFPYDSWGTPFQQLKQVVEEPSPQLPAGQFSPEFVDFSSQWWAFLTPCCFAPGKSLPSLSGKVTFLSALPSFLCSLKKVSKDRPTYAELMVSRFDVQL